jgi:TfoX/Sxy family transcriptional regulator of competence genes
MFTAKGLLEDAIAIKLRCDGVLLQKLKEAVRQYRHGFAGPLY